jgi:hypothetical protein
MGVDSEGRGALNQQEASVDLGSLIIALGKGGHHLLAELVSMGVRVGGRRPGSLFFGLLGSDSVWGVLFRENRVPLRTLVGHRVSSRA